MTLCGWYARQTISLSVLAQNPNKGFELEISDKKESGWGKEVPREDKGSVDKGTQRGQSTTDRRRDRSAWDSSPGEGRSAEGDREGRQSKMGWHSYYLVEVSRKIRAGDSLQMHGNSRCHKIPFFAFGADISPYCSFVFFSPILSVVFFLWP